VTRLVALPVSFRNTVPRPSTKNASSVCSCLCTVSRVLRLRIPPTAKFALLSAFLKLKTRGLWKSTVNGVRSTDKMWGVKELSDNGGECSNVERARESTTSFTASTEITKLWKTELHNFRNFVRTALQTFRNLARTPLQISEISFGTGFQISEISCGRRFKFQKSRADAASNFRNFVRTPLQISEISFPRRFTISEISCQLQQNSRSVLTENIS
jgi:hypothetical protein